MERGANEAEKRKKRGRYSTDALEVRKRGNYSPSAAEAGETLFPQAGAT